MRRLRNIAVNLSIALASVVLFLALCEFVVFRTVWPAGDIPRLDFAADLVRFAPNQQGVWRLRDQIAAPYRINGQGWNSAFGDYVRARQPGTRRIAVVGDSFVEALQVANTDCFAEVVGRELTQRGPPTEIYRFGISGAPLSQYVHMIERAVVDYRPDWIVVLVVFNDFDESYRFIQGRYTSSFLKFRVEDGKVVGEIPPTPWRSDLVEWLRGTATARFFYYRWQVHPEFFLNLLLPRPANAETRDETGADIGPFGPRRDLVAVTDHAVTRLTALAQGIGARLLLVMDGDSRPLYPGRIAGPVLELKRILAEAAQRHGVDFLDLQPVFAADWAAQHRRFEFDFDAHWNELGHSVVGRAIAARIGQAQ